jgi:hypothetical protein
LKFKETAKVAGPILDNLPSQGPSLDEFIEEIKKELNLDKFLNATFDDDGNIVFPNEGNATRQESIIPFLRMLRK